MESSRTGPFCLAGPFPPCIFSARPCGGVDGHSTPSHGCTRSYLEAGCTSLADGCGDRFHRLGARYYTDILRPWVQVRTHWFEPVFSSLGVHAYERPCRLTWQFCVGPSGHVSSLSPVEPALTSPRTLGGRQLCQPLRYSSPLTEWHLWFTCGFCHTAWLPPVTEPWVRKHPPPFLLATIQAK